MSSKRKDNRSQTGGEPSVTTPLLGERFRDNLDDVPDLPPPDDLPPQYTNLPDETAHTTDPLGPGYYMDPPRQIVKAPWGEYQCYMDPRLDSDPEHLKAWIEYLALYPPRPFVRILGTHSEEERRNGKSERTSVTDFDVRVELTAFLYSDVRQRECWRVTRTVENLEKVRRGTVFRTRAPGFGGRARTDAEQQGQQGGFNSDKAGLLEWCHLYCASHSPLKSFLLRRRIQGLDEEWLRSRLESMVRETGYCGQLQVTFPVVDSGAEVYNASWINAWRMKNWIRWIFYLTLMFIFVWPWLFFTTKRFEVVVADWYFSRIGPDGRKQYVSLSEEAWYRVWGKGLQRAVLGRRRGVLDQRDLVDLGTEEGLVGAVRGAVEVVSRQYGWGADSY